MSSDTDNDSRTAAAVVRPLLAERIGYLFAKLHHRWATESVAALRQAGLGLSGMHFGVLTIVREAGPLSQQELGELIGKDRTTVVAIVDELEGEGLVERRRNPRDRRAYALELTRRGEDWLERARPVLQHTDEELLADLDEGERATMAGLLRRVLLGAAADRRR